MGWTHHQFAPTDPKAELDGMLTGGISRVLQSAFVGSTYYAAVETIDKGERSVWAAVCLTQSSGGAYGWGYKDMDESMGPAAAQCPASILQMLTPTDSQYANAWRERCAANAGISRAQTDMFAEANHG